MGNRTTEQLVRDIIDSINQAGYDQATREQIERWYEEPEDLGDVLVKLLEQGKIYYTKGAYYTER
jgi:hypothetical protein